VNKNNFLSELQRRNVIRAAILYLGGVWALAQGISQLGPSLGAPEWAMRWLLVAAAIGFPFWIAFAWFYEFTPEKDRKDYGPAVCVMGLIDAALGKKEAALQEGRQAMELLPIEKDALDGQKIIAYFAVIAGWAGEKDLALQQLATAAPTSGAALITGYGMLKLSPFWDPLRDDPRFEKIVQSLAPKDSEG